MRVAIIGSAGRKDDADKVNLGLYAKMCRKVQELTKGDVTLVSGGAAFSDHVAVSVYLMNRFLSDRRTWLELHLPAPWNHDDMCYVSHKFRDVGSVANYYHTEFCKRQTPDFMENKISHKTKRTSLQWNC